MTTVTTHRRSPRVPRPFAPPRRMIRWPFSPFATVVMIVFPMFWPILGIMIMAEMVCLVFYATLFLVGNALLYIAWLLAALFMLVFGRWL